MTLNLATLVCDLGDGQGNYLSWGLGSFSPTATLTDSTDHLIAGGTPVVPVAFKAGNTPPQVKLIATDNVDVSPSGWAWTFTPPSTSNIAPFSFYLPYAGGATQYLSALAPVQNPQTFQAYMPLPAGTPQAGMVPVATGSGSGSAWADVAWVTVSPIGLATSGVTVANNGAQFGPDTSGTVTCGIQEALNSLPACIVSDKSGNTVAGQNGALLLLPGVFSTTGLITVPPGVITIQGSGWSSWIPIRDITPYQNLGGTAIVTTNLSGAACALSVPLGSYSNPATMLNLRDLDIRIVSPATEQGGSAPPVVGIPGWIAGEIRNLNVLEVETAAVIGNNMLRILDVRSGSSKDQTTMLNVRAYGGNIAITLGCAHLVAIGITGGSVTNSIVTYPRCIDIEDNPGNFYADFHAFSGLYGLNFGPYGTVPQYTPCVIHGFMFEATTHYLTSAGATPTGTLIIENPCWNEPGVDPRTDIPAHVAAGITVLTKYEEDQTGDAGQVMHVTAAKSSATAGTSPYTFTQVFYDQIFVITTVGGMTTLTLDGQALFNGSFTVGQQVYVGAGHSLIATWATTAPVFEVLPL